MVRSLRLVGVLLLLPLLDVQGQSATAPRVWYSLSNRVAIFAEPSLGARQVGVLPRPGAICVVGMSGRFAEVRFITSPGRLGAGYIERLKLDVSPLSPDGKRRVEQVCRVPVPASVPTLAAVRASEKSVAPAAQDVAEADPDAAPLQVEEPKPVPVETPAPAADTAISPEFLRRIEGHTSRLALAQEVYFSERNVYAASIDSLRNTFMPEEGIEVSLLEGTVETWRARILAAGRTCDVRHSVDSGSVIRCR